MQALFGLSSKGDLPLRSPEKRTGCTCAHESRARSLLIKLAVGATVLLALVGLRKLALGGGATAFFIAALNGVQGIGIWAVPLLITCESAAFLLMVPISPLHIGMGFIYGPARGLLLAWAAYAIGCVPPFLLVRVPFIGERFAQIRRRMDILDGVFSAVELEPFKLIVCLRLSPLLPSPLNSYLLGLTNVPLRTYVLASLVGALPNVCAYVYLGTLLDSLADIASGRVRQVWDLPKGPAEPDARCTTGVQHRFAPPAPIRAEHPWPCPLRPPSERPFVPFAQSPLTWMLLLTGCVATVGGIVYVSRIATRRINAARLKAGDSVSTAELAEAFSGGSVGEKKDHA